MNSPPPSLFSGSSGPPPSSVPRSERPAVRLAEHSPAYLSDTELISLLLPSNRPIHQLLETARSLLSKAGSVRGIARMSLPELVEIDGIGVTAATSLQAALALATRSAAPESNPPPSMECPSNVVDLMKPRFLHLEQEEFHALLLNTKHRFVRDVLVTVGLLDRSHVHAREVFRQAIRESCARVILVHNHPSGDPTPSHQDVESTKTLVEAGRIIGIEVLDHVVVGRPCANRPKDYISFREENLLS